ncbi:DNA polymerase I [Chloracidobacterium aggregatum]|uniref:DNA polymerase I n=1 Tax=Chloracidobacterium aggregatum TaxID=2851959 RepID=UPI001B8C61E0|nr:DNA polymerase I [Chloracidobacterium aggregatum]QUV83862.1 DNA polymerase I [Chloracidobacterium sp. 2]QUV87657.1 DNA polymerase I [Chloracidobacterium sp. S]QUV90556.1 DNA polymerase I [Chloracidobacterium sp. A]QUV96958.1 DNA polymerase I [Chloracidobacterium sp. E]
MPTSPNARHRLFLVDAMAHIYRAYYAVRGLATKSGQPTNAVFGFTSIVRKLQKTYAPEYLVVAMDSAAPSFRKAWFEDYKANRAEMPADLQEQIPLIEKVCDALRIPRVKVDGYEADDLIGTLARLAVEQGLEAVIVSNDKDMTQLVRDGISILRVDNKSGEFVFCDRAGVEAWIGVPPEQVVDVLALWGDSSDNIPGAPGIGEKGAVQIIRQFGSLDEALARHAEVSRKTYREALRDHQATIALAKRLVTICQEAPVTLDLEAFRSQPPDAAACYELFSALEFKALTAEFAKLLAAAEQVPTATPAAAVTTSYHGLTTAEALRRAFDSVYVRDSFAFHFEDDAGVMTRGSLSFGPGHALRFERAALDAGTRDGLLEILANGLVNKACHDAKRALYLINCPPHSGVPATEALASGQDFRFESLRDDVHLAGYLLDPGVKAERLTLTGLAETYLGLEAGAVQALDPADVVSRLQAVLRPKLESEGLLTVYETMELPLTPVLYDVECAGVRIDPAPLVELEAELRRELERLTTEIYELAGEPFNINSPQQVADIFEKLNYETSKKTATGRVSTSADVLEELAETYDLPRLILEYREHEKLLNTYVTVLPRLVHPATGRLHTTFTQTVTATGRLSSVRPNLQNIPIRTEMGRRTRRAFVAEEGCRLISADYSQIELRLLAHITEDARMTAAFQAGEDIHERTARDVFGAQTPEELQATRRLAKATNFGIAYGVGAYGLARNVGIGRKEAKKAIDAYFAAYPGIRRYMEETPENARRTGVVRTLYGRLRRMPDLNSRNFTVRSRAEREAINAPIQGTAADLMKLAMIEVARRLPAAFPRARLVLQVHDELLLEAPAEDALGVAALVRSVMEGVATLRVPLVVEARIGTNWLEAK